MNEYSELKKNYLIIYADKCLKVFVFWSNLFYTFGHLKRRLLTLVSVYYNNKLK